MTITDSIISKWPRLTTAQVILGLTLFISIWLAYLTVDVQFNRQISSENQKNIATQTNETHQLLEKQGNISSAQRQALLNQFESIAQQGGFATKVSIEKNLAQTFINKHNIENILGNMTQINAKLDKLPNLNTSVNK